MQNPVHRFQAVLARRQAKLGFMLKFPCPRIHVLLIDIGRVADHEIVLYLAESREKVGLDRMNAIFEAVTLHIDSGDRERIVRYVHRIDDRLGECQRHRDRYATAARTQVDCTMYCGRRNPRGKSVPDEFGERRARHQHAFVHIEFETGEPGLVDQVRDRNALVDAACSQREHRGGFVVAHLIGIDTGRVVMREPQHGKYQPRGFVDGVVRAMSVGQVRHLETGRDIANELLDRHCARIYHADGASACRIAASFSDTQVFHMGPRNLITAIVLGLALAVGIFMALRMQTPVTPESALVLPTPSEVPEFSLVDQQGAAIDRTVFRGQWDLVFFGFTHCPDICPTTLQVLAAAKSALAAQGQTPLPRIVLVSVDPERDTPELLGEYVDYFGDGNLGITGTLEEITRLTSGLGIFFEKQSADGNNYAVDHSTAVLVIDPDGGFHAVFSGPHVVENYVHDLPIIMTGS